MKISYKQRLLITLSLAILIIIFLWGETFDLNKKINDQKIGNFFLTVFTIVGTISAIYYTKKQYELSEKTTLYSIKPDLIPKDAKAHVIEEFRFGFNPSINEPGKIKVIAAKNFSDRTSKGVIEIENEGVGLAKHVSIYWVLDEDAIDEKLLSIYAPRYSTMMDKHSSLKPGEKFYTSFPEHYLIVLHSLFSEESRASYLDNSKKNNIPKLNLQVRFSDIHNNRYLKVFQVNVFATTIDLRFSFYEEKASFL